MNSLVKYIVTDPCYVLSSEQWSECCKVFDNKDDELMYQRFDEAVTKALTEYSGFPAYASGTGYGDWSNAIYGPKIIEKDFFADAGMVCVCRLTPEIEKHFNDRYPHNSLSGIAIFKMSEKIEVNFDTSDCNWTVVRIKDQISGEEITSLDSSDMKDEEDESDYDYEE